MNKAVMTIVLIFTISNLCIAQINSMQENFWQPIEGNRNRISTNDMTEKNIDHIIVKSGGNCIACNLHDISGIIQRIWFTFSAEDTLYLQKIYIKMTFDDEVTVDHIPIGMFTGTGPWYVNDLNTPVINIMRSRRLNEDQKNVGAGSFNIHWPMPFTSNVKIEFHNTSTSAIKLFYYIDYLEVSHNITPFLFHATYNIKSPTKPDNNVEAFDSSKNFKFLSKDNYQGRYVGTILCVESHPDRKGKWYEGDDLFIIDNECSLRGTGTEDYFGMAWGYHRRYQAFDHGVTHFEKNITDHDRFFDGRYVTYRFHINDPIIFYKSIDASIESGRENECEQHYESVAIWYGQKN